MSQIINQGDGSMKSKKYILYFFLHAIIVILSLIYVGISAPALFHIQNLVLSLIIVIISFTGLITGISLPIYTREIVRQINNNKEKGYANKNKRTKRVN
jgi:hypothetical protein